MKRNGKSVWLAAAVILLILAAVSGGIWLRQEAAKNQVEEQRNALAEQVNPSEEDLSVEEPEVMEPEVAEPEVTEKDWDEYTLEEKYRAYLDTYGIDVPPKNLNFEELRAEVNKDIYAWIYVPETNIDDPVVQHPTDDSYYLNFNLDGSMGYPGGIYTEGSCNSRDFTDRMTVIYGHNMKDGSGFGSLHNFEQETVFNESRYIFIYLQDDIKVYEIFAAYEGSSAHIIYSHAWDDESWVQYLSDTLLLTGDKDQAVDSYGFEADDLVLTLSTCVRNSPNQRYLVQGVLLDEAR